MTDERSQSGTKKAASPPAAKEQGGGGRREAGQQPAGPPPAEESLAERARREYLQILQELAVVTQHRPVRPLRGGAQQPKRWCLPDVSCPARLTLTKEAEAAFDDNRSFCNPIVIE